MELRDGKTYLPLYVVPTFFPHLNWTESGVISHLISLHDPTYFFLDQVGSGNKLSFKTLFPSYSLGMEMKIRIIDGDGKTVVVKNLISPLPEAISSVSGLTLEADI